MPFDFASLLEQMQQPDFFPHPIKQPIEKVQTHASVVLLTGDYAYKLKKSVNFGFLDYSTLAKRKHFLEQELTLNQAIAPEIYLEVLPISQSGQKLILGDSTNPVEYTLKMHQFPENCLLSNLFEQKKLTADMMVALGKVVAKFHQKTQTNDNINAFGNVKVIKKAIEDNYTATQPYLDITQTPKQFQETRQFTETFLSVHKAAFQQRQDNHKIRECHGDLHLGNICFWHNQLQLFDRIEFNEEFRFVDVMYDIAFTVMDLMLRNRVDFANIFLNTYLEQSGDWQGLEVFPLYLCRQAYVRGKVTSLLLNDPEITPEKKAESLITAKDYFRLAWDYAHPKKGQLMIMSGLSGSGKTTVARAIAPQLNAIHLRSDAIRKQLGAIPLDTPGGEELYTAEMTEKTYSRLLELAALLIAQGYKVILDAKFDRQVWRKQAKRLAMVEDVPFAIIHCQAALNTLSDRLKQRTRDISDATADLLEQQQQQAEALSSDERPFTFSMDTEKTDKLPQLIHWLMASQP